MRVRNRYWLKRGDLQQAQFDTTCAFCDIQGRSACEFHGRYPDQTIISGGLNLPLANQGKLR
jgi:hypothetical protein